jgi:hypothetical protein
MVANRDMLLAGYRRYPDPVRSGFASRPSFS